MRVTQHALDMIHEIDVDEGYLESLPTVDSEQEQEEGEDDDDKSTHSANTPTKEQVGN